MKAEFKLPLLKDSDNTYPENESLTIISHNMANEITLKLRDREIIVDKNDLKAIINIV